MDKLIRLLSDVESGVSIDGSKYICLHGLGLVGTDFAMYDDGKVVRNDVFLTDSGMELLGILEWHEKVERGDKWL